MSEGTGVPRRPGRPAKLSRERIVAAASELPLDSLTMQGVADRLGVDRKALNYYVSDRAGLLQLLALNAFETEIAGLRFGPETGWPELLRLCAAAMRAAYLQVGGLISAIDFGAVRGNDALGTVERILTRLIEAGFTSREAGRTLTLLADIARAAAYETLENTGGPPEPQAHNVVHALAGAGGEQFPALRRIAAERDAVRDRGVQFEFDLDVVLAGLAARLRDRATS
ncbi:TetR/AcrR family transcriptional regulator C-terminal domain-containing protein [Nocardia asteroides]|uniref:TetR/AcrR family transcriptional regulator C-terminal domain-containing protein n=1 Tax=Nocardia asteroides TaxID=1824 RepID=UPI001E5B50D6|nr:TetR/AcrR family transcriptional regulator C-terminal domain-containing protein [Nocardia asteroides]UGT61906.1 TetR/AcrR family transcriptional regulator C-terminal domain-containing protein [Nocardia asteroides]